MLEDEIKVRRHVYNIIGKPAKSATISERKKLTKQFFEECRKAVCEMHAKRHEEEDNKWKIVMEFNQTNNEFIVKANVDEDDMTSGTIDFFIALRA